MSPVSLVARGAAAGLGAAAGDLLAGRVEAAGAAFDWRAAFGSGAAFGFSGADVAFRTTICTAPFGRLKVTSNRWPEYVVVSW